jgi:hypothetical protein
MSPSELNRKIADIEEGLRSAFTACASLIVLALLSVAGGFGVHQLSQGIARTVAVIAVLGAIISLGAAIGLRWRRAEVYEDVIVAGFRHVSSHEVARRAATLVLPSRRRQMAEALDRLADVAITGERTPVPVHREALRACEGQLRSIAVALRHTDTELRAAGMVLLRRLICDGATSPVFRVEAPPRELERLLDVIASELFGSSSRAQSVLQPAA